MKKLKTLLLSACLIAGCRNLDDVRIQEYESGVRKGIKITGEVMNESFMESFRTHLLSDQADIRNFYNACNNIAAEYERSGREEEGLSLQTGGNRSTNKICCN